MKYNLELFYFPECPYCQRVLRTIEQLGLTDITFSDIHQNPAKKETLIKDTGRKTVPCLYIDNKPMFESSDIMQWLETNTKK